MAVKQDPSEYMKTLKEAQLAYFSKLFIGTIDRDELINLITLSSEIITLYEEMLNGEIRVRNDFLEANGLLDAYSAYRKALDNSIFSH